MEENDGPDCDRHVRSEAESQGSTKELVEAPTVDISSIKILLWNVLGGGGQEALLYL